MAVPGSRTFPQVEASGIPAPPANTKVFPWLLDLGVGNDYSGQHPA